MIAVSQRGVALRNQTLLDRRSAALQVIAEPWQEIVATYDRHRRGVVLCQINKKTGSRMWQRPVDQSYLRAGLVKARQSTVIMLGGSPVSICCNGVPSRTMRSCAASAAAIVEGSLPLIAVMPIGHTRRAIA